MATMVDERTPWEQLPANLTVAEASAWLRYKSEWTIREAIARGELPAWNAGVRIRRDLRIRKDDLAAWLEGGQV